MAKPKNWEGKHPDHYESVLGKEPEWTLYLMSKTSNWWQLKLVANGKQPYKGNYQLAYSTKEDRFADKPGQRMLRTHRPRLAEWVRRTVTQAAGTSRPQRPVADAEPKPAPEARDVDPERLLAIYKRLRESPESPITAETHRQAEAEYGPDAPLALAKLLESEVIYEHEGNDYIKEL